MKQAIKFNSIISGASTKKDGSLGIRISTPELTEEEMATIFKLTGISCDVFIKPRDDELEEIVVVDKDLEQKTSSQRLRAVLFVLWKQEEGLGDFSVFYKDRMEKLITAIKNKLD